MKRRLFNLAAAVSLVLCLTTFALLARSFYAEDSIGLGSPFQIDQGISRDGRLFYRRTVFVASAYRTGPQLLRAHPPQWFARSSPPGGPTAYAGLDVFGFAWARLPVPGVGKTTGGFDWFISVPDAMLAVLFAALPITQLLAAVRRVRRQRRGSCPICGYDLRASPERCPECGTPTAKRSEKPTTRRVPAHR